MDLSFAIEFNASVQRQVQRQVLLMLFKAGRKTDCDANTEDALASIHIKCVLYCYSVVYGRNRMTTAFLSGTGLTHWQSSNFFAYYPCNSSFPGMLGEMLCAGFATQNFSWIGSPAATELETVRSLCPTQPMTI